MCTYMYMCVYVCVCMYVTTINDKRSPELKEWRETYMGGFGEKEGEYDVIIL